ncbi:MAG TPA: HdeD family acid-resistance protein [Candidatus Limnocylindrales bacterium]|nr:HdeD family acid-resistance protein [Candidatus Limnocylindrales bacterium]
MLSVLARNWWLVEIRGVAAIAFGVLAFVWPGLTLLVLVTLFAAYMLIDGVALLVSLRRAEPATTGHRLTVAVMGILGVAVGIATIFWPGITALALLYLVAFWAITLGLTQVIAAIRLRREISGELWFVIGGLLTIAFGVLILAFPGTGLLSLIWLVGIWAIVFGITNLVLAWRLRGVHQQIVQSRIPTSSR